MRGDYTEEKDWSTAQLEELLKYKKNRLLQPCNKYHKKDYW